MEDKTAFDLYVMALIAVAVMRDVAGQWPGLFPRLEYGAALLMGAARHYHPEADSDIEVASAGLDDRADGEVPDAFRRFIETL